MFKLILHYNFKADGDPIDLSGFKNHGFPSGSVFAPNGAAPGSGILKFNGEHGRVEVPFKPVWQGLTALRIEALIPWAKIFQPLESWQFTLRGLFCSISLYDV